VPRVRRGTRQRRAFEDFLIRLAHGFSFKLKVESCKRAIVRAGQLNLFPRPSQAGREAKMF
jgi:hypothetical protein